MQEESVTLHYWGISVAIFPLSFGQLAETLELVHAIAPQKSAAFRSRVKHLQRLGFPPGVNTGKGQRAEYGVEEVLLIALAIELLQLGLTPERASGILTTRREVVISELKRSFENLGAAVFRRSVFLYLDPRALIELQDEELFKLRSGKAYESLFFGADSDLAKHFKRRPNAPARLAVLDFGRVVSDIVAFLGPDGVEARKEVADEMVAWGFGP